MAKLTSGNGAFQVSGAGSSVSVSDRAIVVGASGDDSSGTNAGAIYLFEDISADGKWGQTESQTISGSVPGDKLGHGVAISGETIVASAASGAYVFEKNGTLLIVSEEFYTVYKYNETIK